MSPQAVAAAVGGLIAFLLAVALAGSGFTVGRHWERAEWAQKAAQEAQKAREATEAAAERANAAEASLVAARGVIDDMERRAKDAIRSATAGRACLSERARGLLNDAAAGRQPAVPGGDARDAGRSGAAAGDSGGATDTAVAEWAATVIARYETCRGQLAAIRGALGR